MCSVEEYFYLIDENTNTCRVDWSPGNTLGDYVDNNPSLFEPNQDPVFLHKAQNQYMHRESIVDDSVMQAEKSSGAIRVFDSVEINVELYNNEDCKGVVILCNGSITFSDVKDDCERALQLTSDMPIIGWMVDGEDVDASEKVFDHITSPSHSIVAVIELLQNC